MGYIKKLKNNELVGGTDKHTIYPVTSAEAVFEEVSDGEFKSQKYLNNHITNERIVDNTIENDKLKDDTIDMGKLNTQLKTVIQNAYDASWKVKEEPFSLETKYDANDVVYDPDTNSSYVSLTADNQGNPVNPEDEGYVEGKWRIIINGISAVESTEVINAKVEELETEVDNKIDDAQGQLDQMIADAADSLADAESDARGAAAEASAVVANKVADAQVGYFECNTATGTALKQTTFDYIGTGNDKSYYTIPAAGSNVRIKMKYANTASGTVELQFGTNTATRKPLIYSGEPASQNNSWDDGEVLSIYYDPTYNNNTGAYQASNTMGGGSSVKKKILTFGSGFYDTTNAPSQGAAPSSRTSNASFKSVKVPVSEGDFLVINGKASQYGNSRFWATIDSSNNYVKCSELNAGGTDYIIIIPEGVAAIVINCDTRVYANPSGYLLKEGNTEYKAVTDLYIYGDLRTPALGQTYKEGEAIKTADKQLLRLTKEVAAMNLVDTITVGDLKAYGSGSAASTYKALREVKKYNGTETEGLYAIGRPSITTLTVDASGLSIEEDTDILVIINNDIKTITVTALASETKDADIAASIVAAFPNIEGWNITDNEDGTITFKCDTAGNNVLDIVTSVGQTGLVITSSNVGGNKSLNKFSEGSWNDVTLADYAADSVEIGDTPTDEMWKKISLEELITISTQQDVRYYPKTDFVAHSWIYTNANTKQFYAIPIVKGITYTVYIKARSSATFSNSTFYIRNSNGDKIACNETNTDKEIKITSYNFVNGRTITFTPKSSDNYATFNMWTDRTGGIGVDFTISWSDYAQEKYDNTLYNIESETVECPIIITKPVKSIKPYYYLNVSGNEVYRIESNIFVYDYIYCKGARRLSAPCITMDTVGSYITFYDKDKKNINLPFKYERSGVNTVPSAITVTVPKDAYYFRFSSFAEATNISMYYDKEVSTFATGENLQEVRIINNLDTGGANNVLSAEQGVELKRILENLYAGFENVINAFEHTAWIAPGGGDIINSIKNNIYGSTVVSSITAEYNQSRLIFDSGLSSLEDLKEDLLVFAVYANGNKIPTRNYELSGTLQAGQCTITVTYSNKTTTFTVTVSEYGSQTVYSNNDIKTYQGASDSYTLDGVTYAAINDFKANSTRKIHGIDYGLQSFRNKSAVVLSPKVYPFKIPSGTHAMKIVTTSRLVQTAVQFIVLIDGHYKLIGSNGGYVTGPQTVDYSRLLLNNSDIYAFVYSRQEGSGTYDQFNSISIEFV